MQLVAKSDQTTGNQTYCSYVLRSNELVLAFTAPYSSKIEQTRSRMPHPGFLASDAHDFFDAHGLAVRALGILVDDANAAFRVSVENGAISILTPHVLADADLQGRVTISEVKLYGDVVLRFVSIDKFEGPFLPGYESVDALPLSCGLLRMDHAVGNVYKLLEAMKEIAGFTGFHEVAEFTSKDVGTPESGLNSVVLANHNEMVILPLNEPTYGTERRSQVQTYLQHNEGPGLQHLAFICNDIFSTVQEMQMRSHVGGFEFLSKPPPAYYKGLYDRLGSTTRHKSIIQQCEELGILVDKDERGLLLQIFTKPVGDR
ncbi:hypothetical protein O6H91_01G155600 [Diphasiastrum complanatum]|nr:hypothetical protein O6H91_01G155600 [Diphasiastrum complanatum]